MNPEWYYTANGGQQGPVTAADLKKLAQAGTISKEDLVWKEGMPNWVPAKNVKGLFAPLGASGETKAVSQSGESKKAKPAAEPAVPVETAPTPEERPSQSRAKAVREEPPADEPDVAAEEDRPRRSRRDEDEDDRPRRSRRDEDDDDRPRSSRRRDDDDDDDDRSRRSSRGRYDDDDDEFDDYDDRPKRKRLKKGVKPGTGLGIGSMICGIAGLLAVGGSCFFGAFCFLGLAGYGISGILSIVAVGLGFPAMKTEGKGFGIAGLVTGFIGLVPVILSLMAFIFGAAFFGVNALAN